MITFSTRQAARKLGLSHVALAHYIKVGKIPEPQIMNVGGRNIHVWTEAEIEHIRRLLPKIANGRKMRWQRQKTQASAPVPRKKVKPKKK